MKGETEVQPDILALIKHCQITNQIALIVTHLLWWERCLRY